MGLPRVLLILVEPPLPFGNPASRWSHVLVQQLEKHGYDFDVLVACGVEEDFIRAQKEFKSASNIFLFPFEKSKGIGSKINSILYPYRYHASLALMNKLRELDPNSYDIIHAENTWAGWATREWAHKSVLFVHFVLGIDLNNVKPQGWRQRLLFWRWFATEKKIIAAHPNIVACSPRIVNHIEQWDADHKNLVAIPFGIDLSLYPFIPKEKRQTAKAIVTIVGNMNWSPSLTAAQRLITRLWPEIHKQMPESRLRIVGWGARERLKEFLHMDIEVLENVPETRPYFEEASVLVYAPGRGSGMKIKIMEALAYGVPVVTTDEGVEGLVVEDMKHVAIGKTDQELIAKTVKILKDANLQEALRVNGRKMLEEQCNPQVTFGQVEAFYQKVLANK